MRWRKPAFIRTLLGYELTWSDLLTTNDIPFWADCSRSFCWQNQKQILNQIMKIPFKRCGIYGACEQRNLENWDSTGVLSQAAPLSLPSLLTLGYAHNSLKDVFSPLSTHKPLLHDHIQTSRCSPEGKRMAWRTLLGKKLQRGVTRGVMWLQQERSALCRVH